MRAGVNSVGDNSISNQAPYAAAQLGICKTKARRQYGAIPYAIDMAGRVRIVLVTSRETGRWIIPKGWPMAGRKPAQAAVHEVYEEAGLVGVVPRAGPIGHYCYTKQLSKGRVVTCDVAVFLLHVPKRT